MPKYIDVEDEVIETECRKTSRFLSWETGEIRSLEEATQLCDKVDTCEYNCECRLRDSYYFFLNEAHKDK